MAWDSHQEPLLCTMLTPRSWSVCCDALRSWHAARCIGRNSTPAKFYFLSLFLISCGQVWMTDVSVNGSFSLGLRFAPGLRHRQTYLTMAGQLEESHRLLSCVRTPQEMTHTGLSWHWKGLEMSEPLNLRWQLNLASLKVFLNSGWNLDRTTNRLCDRGPQIHKAWLFTRSKGNHRSRTQPRVSCHPNRTAAACFATVFTCW